MSSNASTPWATAARVLRDHRIWLGPLIALALVPFLLTMIYMGSILDPGRDLHRLPIGLVNSDRGAELAGRHQNLGREITAAVAAAPDPDDHVAWRVLDEKSARDQMDSDRIYGVFLVPGGFTASVAALTQPPRGTPVRPEITVRTNPGAGSLGSQFASNISQQAVHEASTKLGTKLTAGVPESGATAGTAARLMLADPIAAKVTVGHPIGARSGLGLSAFYYTLLLVLSGFLGANIISSGVDVSLGYTASEFGPWRKQRPVVPISRTRTLAVKCVMSAVLSLLSSGAIMLAAITLLDMSASHLPLLWIFSVCASAAVGFGVQAINAAFGGFGQLISMFLYVALAVPSSGATTPLQALPPFYRWLSAFEPMRQLVDGVRSILFFDARADAGLTRAWFAIGVGAVVALVFGFAMTEYYDRKNLHRVVPSAA